MPFFSLQCTNAFNKAWDSPPPTPLFITATHWLEKLLFFCYIFWFFFFLTHKNTHNKTSELYRKVPRCTQNSGGIWEKIWEIFFHFGRREVATPIGTETSGSDNLNLSLVCAFLKVGWVDFSTTITKKYWLKTTTHNATLEKLKGKTTTKRYV